MLKWRLFFCTVFQRYSCQTHETHDILCVGCLFFSFPSEQIYISRGLEQHKSYFLCSIRSSKMEIWLLANVSYCCHRFSQTTCKQITIGSEGYTEQQFLHHCAAANSRRLPTVLPTAACHFSLADASFQGPSPLQPLNATQAAGHAVPTR